MLAWRLLPADRLAPGGARSRLDVIGLGLLAPSLAGIALLGAFIAWATRPGDRHPVVDVRLLRLRSLGSASAVLATAGAAMYAGMFLLPLYYQQLHGESVLNAGLLLIPQGIGSSTGSGRGWSRSPALVSRPPRPCRSR